MSTEFIAEHPDTPLIIKKVVLRFLPMMLLMYMLAYLDRANIGFAQTSMEVDMGVSAAAFSLGAGLFFLGYAVAEIPSNFIMAKVGAKIWLSRIMVTFGLVAIATTFVHSEWNFFALRILLGVAEGGLFPGIVLFLTYWIPASYWARVMGVFIFGAPLAFIFGSPLSGSLLSLDGLFGLHGWQIMFLMTGLATTAVGIWAYFYLDNVPEKARFLTESERAILGAEMRKEVKQRERISPQGLGRTVTNWRVLFFTLIYFTIQVGIFGVVFYLPGQIALITGRRAGVANGFLTAVPWTFSILAVIVLTRIADRHKNRAVLAFGCLFLGGLGIVGGAMAHMPAVSLGAFSLAAAGLMSVQPMFWIWPTGMLAGSAAAGGLAFINAVGNLGGFVAPNLKTWVDSEAGNGVAGLVALGGITAAGSLLLLAADIVRRSAPVVRPAIVTAVREE